MPAFYLDHPSVQLIHTKDTPFASGGEGELYHIESPAEFANLVVKIYRAEKRSPERMARLQYLLAHPPQNTYKEKHQALTWLQHLVFDQQGEAIGFVMPFAKGIKLEMLCANRLPNNLGPEWQRFDFAHPDALRLRLKLCYNIAAALFQIHQTGSYVLVDMKPENIMVQANGLISIIDIDSIQIQQGREVLFAAPVATPEFTPPEYYRGIEPGKTPISQSWDYFSMAVIFYKLLLGIHPFAGNNHKAPYNNCQTISDMIEHALFPFGSRAEFMGVVPPLHQRFGQLEQTLQGLFLRCFAQGHQQPELRPDADEWCRETTMLLPFVVYRPSLQDQVPLPSLALSSMLELANVPEEFFVQLPYVPQPEEEYNFTAKIPLAVIIVLGAILNMIADTFQVFIAMIVLFLGYKLLNAIISKKKTGLKKRLKQQLETYYLRQKKQKLRLTRLERMLSGLRRAYINHPQIELIEDRKQQEWTKITEINNSISIQHNLNQQRYHQLCLQEQQEINQHKQGLRQQLKAIDAALPATERQQARDQLLLKAKEQVVQISEKYNREYEQLANSLRQFIRQQLQEYEALKLETARALANCDKTALFDIREQVFEKIRAILPNWEKAEQELEAASQQIRILQQQMKNL